MKIEFDEFLKKLVNYIDALDNEITETESEDDSVSINSKDLIEELEKTIKDLSVSNINLTISNENNKRKVRANSEFVELMKSMNTLDKERMPYSKITESLFNKSANEEFLDLIGKSIENNWNFYKVRNDPDPELSHKFFKLKEHIALSVIQRRHINFSLKTRIREVESEMGEFKEQVENYKNELDLVRKEAQQNANAMITQFIGILGIFSAILMGAFGSIQGFTSLFNNANNLALGKLVVISSIGCMVVIFIIFILMHSLSKMIGFSLSSCNCHRQRVRPRRKGITSGIFDMFKTNTDEDTYCTCSPIQKYPVLIYVNYFLVFMGMTGLSMMLWTSNESYLEFLQTDLGPIASITGVFIAGFLLLVYLHIGVMTKERRKRS